MNFIDDDILNRAKDVPRLSGGKNEIERFRSGDENVRWVLHHRRSTRLWCIPGSDCCSYFRRLQPLNLCFFTDSAERSFEIALNVVTQRLQRRDIEATHPWRCVILQVLFEQVVDGPQESGKSFPRSCRSEDERVSTRCNARPAPVTEQGSVRQSSFSNQRRTTG